MKHSLLVAIVDRGKAEGLMASAKRAGSPGGTILTARAVDSNMVLNFLGLDEVRKEILLMMVSEKEKKPVWDAIVESKYCKGIVASFAASWDASSSLAPSTSEWDMVAVICNHGYGDDVLAAMRRIGHVGGFIIEGRGTAHEEDTPFFWVNLVPEKELVLSFVHAESTEEILEAIAALKILQPQGSGIAFSFKAEELITKPR